MNDDPHIREMGCDPQGSAVFITDGTTAVGQSLVRGFVEAGAKRIWAGIPPGRTFDQQRAAAVTVVPLDVTSNESAAHAARGLGAGVDIFVNNARHDAGEAAEASREEMEINYFGLLNLSCHFAPAMQLTSATGESRAWVNLLSIYALANLPSQTTFSASMAAAMSLSQGLRARWRPAGLRVVNVFCGPVAPTGLATAVVEALRNGVEDVYPGDVAQEWLARWLQSPKAFERELAG